MLIPTLRRLWYSETAFRVGLFIGELMTKKRRDRK